MRDDVKACVDARVNFFDQYYTVPANVQPEVDSFIKAVIDLGEGSADATSFESEFVSSGLSNQFNAILPKCTPKAAPVSAQYQEYSAQVEREFKEERKKQFADTLINDVTDSVVMKAESDAITAKNRQMAEAGILDDYTKVTNVVEDAGSAVGFLGKLFGKKKK